MPGSTARLHGSEVSTMGGLFMSGVLLSVVPASAIPEGPGRIEARIDQHTLVLFTYKPEHYQDGPAILVFHGMHRNADKYRDYARGMGDRFGALIVAPSFPAARFPVDAYNHGGIVRAGRPQPPQRWTGRLLPQLIAEIRRREDRHDLPCYLVGHSAGGQFLSRAAGFVETEAERIVVTAPGTLLFPTRNLPFPYGFGRLPGELGDREALRRYLAQPLTIYVGTDDTGTRNLPQNVNAQWQGVHRYQRARNAFRRGRELAEAHGWEFHWRLVEAPGVAHSSRALFDHENCAEALFVPLER